MQTLMLTSQHLDTQMTADPVTAVDNCNLQSKQRRKNCRSDFTADDDSNVTLGNLNITTGNYQPTKYAFEVAGNTPQEQA